jgi:RHS repeat-associated protein
VVWQAHHDPFGRASVTAQAVVNNLRFPGQYFDAETGVHYNYFRDYDPSLGRYIQSDPIGLAGGINTYAYVDSNPVSFYDSSGQGKTGAAVGGTIGGVVGRIAGGIFGGTGGAAGGTLVAPGVGTVGGGAIGAAEGAAAGGLLGAAAGAAIGSPSRAEPSFRVPPNGNAPGSPNGIGPLSLVC